MAAELVGSDAWRKYLLPMLENAHGRLVEDSVANAANDRPDMARDMACRADEIVRLTEGILSDAGTPPTRFEIRSLVRPTATD